jgi:hypothetical protein
VIPAITVFSFPFLLFMALNSKPASVLLCPHPLW